MSRFRLRYRGQDLALPAGMFTIGRSDECDLCLEDESMSRVHAQFIVGSDTVRIEDLKSRNGVKVNGKKIDKKTVVVPGDRIQIGQQVMLLTVRGGNKAKKHAPKPTIAPAAMKPSKNIFHVLVSVGETALRHGRVDYAAMLGEHVFHSLRNPPKSMGRASAADAELARSFALELADATDAAHWRERATEAEWAINMTPADGIRVKDPLIGRTLRGAYRLDESIGAGGMGRVYRAEQIKLGRPVAVKVIHPHFSSRHDAVARFNSEARAASQLSHPNSVSVIDFGRTDDDILFLVMEYIEGNDLGAVHDREGPLSFELIVQILGSVCDALAEAHATGIVHRDLKPENIVLLEQAGNKHFVKVLDYGLATLMEGGPGLTAPGVLLGTPAYLSPEQARGDKSDARADIYTLGVICYELMSGRLPFEGDEPMEVALAHVLKEVPDPRSVSSRELPDALVDVTMRCLKKDPNHRYQSAIELKAALAAAVADGASPPVPSAECPSCGAVWTESRRFCGKCGARLSTVPSPT